MTPAATDSDRPPPPPPERKRSTPPRRRKRERIGSKLILLIKPLIYARDIARLLDCPQSPDPEDRWNRRRAARLLAIAPYGEQLWPGGPWVTSLELLAEHSPLLYRKWLARLSEDDLARHLAEQAGVDMSDADADEDDDEEADD